MTPETPDEEVDVLVAEIAEDDLTAVSGGLVGEGLIAMP
jgi:hypothetical protein